MSASLVDVPRTPPVAVQAVDCTVTNVVTDVLAIVAEIVRVPVVAVDDALSVAESAPDAEVVPDEGEIVTFEPEIAIPVTAALVVPVPENWSVCEVEVPLLRTQAGEIVTVGVVEAAQIGSEAVRVDPPTTAWRLRVLLAAPDGAVTDAVNCPAADVGVLGVPTVTVGLFVPMIPRLATAALATAEFDASRTRKVTVCAVPFGVTQVGEAMLRLDGTLVQEALNCICAVFEVTAPTVPV